MFSGESLLLGKRFCNIWMLDKFRNTFSFVLIVLQTLTQKEDAFKSKVLFNGFFEVIVTSFNFTFKFGSVAGVEWSLTVKKFEKNDSERPNICFVGIRCFLNYLRSHVKRSSTDGFVNLTFALQLFGETKICYLNFKFSSGQINVSQKSFSLFFVHRQYLI